MDLTYFKRYRMEIDLPGRNLAPGSPPAEYRFVPWQPGLLESFAEAKYLSFRGELDANVFTCLGDLDGCRRLMTEIVRKPGFLPEATWLLSCQRSGPGSRPVPGQPELCGTVQGIRDPAGLGAIQNLGIVPERRNCGLGTALLFRSLAGFLRAGVTRVYLEVTAQNEGAIRLYRRLGFITVKTVYKAVEPVYS
ncbi:MAG: GNAT family N-acetyltransferase [Thermoguttaceae bacterium]|jgi:ribosomal protein S18 acetylase RimI-like enzyme